MAAKKSSKSSHSIDNKVNPATTAASSKTPAATPANPAAAAPVAALATVTASAAPASPAVATAPRVETRDRSGIIALLAKLRDNDAEVARDAAVTLGTLPADAEAIEVLCQVVRNPEHFFHPVVRAAAAATLGRLNDRRAVDALIVATSDTMAEASEEAVKALGLLRDARAVPTLQAIIRNGNGFYLEIVRRTAEAALARMNTKA